MILKLFAYLFAAIGLCVALFAGYQYMDLRSLAFAGAGQQMTDNKFLLAMLERAAGSMEGPNLDAAKLCRSVENQLLGIGAVGLVILAVSATVLLRQAGHGRKDSQ